MNHVLINLKMELIDFLKKAGFVESDTHKDLYLLKDIGEVWSYDMNDSYWANLTVNELFIKLESMPRYGKILFYLNQQKRIIVIDSILEDLQNASSL